MIDKPLTPTNFGVPFGLDVQDGAPAIEIEIGGLGGVLDAPVPEPKPYDHKENLAETLPSDMLSRIVSDLEYQIDNDKASRSDWENTYKKGVDILGLKIEERSQPWEGACGVVHPMILEAVVRFQAEMVTATFPAAGPTRTKILGEETPEKRQAALRVEAEMNHQLTDVMTEFRPEHERLMWHLPMMGCGFKKVYKDAALGRQTSMFVDALNVFLPYGTTDLTTCPRITHEMRKTSLEIRQLIAAGIYADVYVPESTQGANTVQSAKDREAGQNALNDVRPELYEVHFDMVLNDWRKGSGKGAVEAEVEESTAFGDIEVEDMDAVAMSVEVDVEETDDDQVRPYIITFVKGSGTPLALRRNWDENDHGLIAQREDYFVQYDYVPGFGSYGYGLIHLVGGYAQSATSLLRQLVDAGTLSNLPGGYKARGTRVTGEDEPIAPGEWRDIDIPSGTLKDNLLPLPYKEPSGVLAQLLTSIIQQGQRTASTADLEVGTMTQNAPVGTTMALLERSLKVMTAVQARAHASLKKELKLLAKIIAADSPAEYGYDPVQAQRGARAEDFSLTEIIPVSDPNATTLSQRIIQYQAVTQMAQMAPQVYDQAFLHREMLDVFGIRNAEKLVPLPTDAKPVDPITENMSIMSMKPVKAFIQQDHQAHMAVHQALLQDPKIQQAIGQNPAAQQMQVALMAHVAEHAAFDYRMRISQQLGMPLPDPSQPIDPQVEVQIAPMLAQAAQQTLMMSQKMAAQQAAQQQQQDPTYQLEVKKLQQADNKISIMAEEAKTRKFIAETNAAAQADKEDRERFVIGMQNQMDRLDRMMDMLQQQQEQQAAQQAQAQQQQAAQQAQAQQAQQAQMAQQQEAQKAQQAQAQQAEQAKQAQLAKLPPVA